MLNMKSRRKSSTKMLSTTMGMPSWLVGGILVPWIVADLFTIWMCFFFIKDDDLGTAGDEVGHGRPVSEVMETEGGAA